MENDKSLVKIKITEYDSFSEIMADLSGSAELRTASHNGWVDIGPDKCALHVLTKGYLILSRNKKGMWSGSFRYENNDFRGKNFPVPLEADTLTLAVQAADTWVSKKFKGLTKLTSRRAAYRNDGVTEAQKKALSRYKNVASQPETKGQAMDLLTRLKLGQLKIWKTQLKMGQEQKKQHERKLKEAVLVRTEKRFVDSATQTVDVK